MVLDSARPEIIEGLRRKNFKAKGSKKGAGSVLDGIQRMTSYEIIVDPSNSDTVLEAFSRYEWKTGSLEAPNHDFSHIPDAIRYGVMYLTQGSSGNYYIDGHDYVGGRDYSIR
jgi:phage terminase large subunit